MCEIQNPVEKEQICLFGHLFTQRKTKLERERGEQRREKKITEKVGGPTGLDHPDREIGVGSRERDGKMGHRMEIFSGF